MRVERLELVDFRNYTAATFELSAGTTVVVGDNGHGKTNLVEALAYLATLDSFRGAPTDALVRVGATSGVVRAVVRHDDPRPGVASAEDREVLVEAEVVRTGRNKVLVNKQRLARARDLLGVVRVTVFSPDDLTIVKGGPGERRRFLDDTLVALAAKYDALRLELDRVVRQRNTLLKQMSGSAGPPRATDPDVDISLDVWDARLADVGERFGHARSVLVDRLHPFVAEAYEHLAGRATEVRLTYQAPWRANGLLTALCDARGDDLRRQVSTVGPHRDELDVLVNGLPARTHASQGEQRTVVLALRLAAHRLVTDRTGASPVLVLDDVLSELDPGRARALISLLPAGQVLITTAGDLPATLPATVDRILHISAGAVVAG